MLFGVGYCCVFTQPTETAIANEFINLDQTIMDAKLKNSTFDKLKLAPIALAAGAGLMMAAAVPGQAASQLSVDFSPSTSAVAAGYAGFIFSNNAIPGTRTYLSGSTGYTGSMDTGTGIGVTLASVSGSSAFRMVDRGGTNLLLRDFAGRDGINLGQDLKFAGLVAGSYSLTIPLTDLSNQQGVVDVQLSTNGGTSFSNVHDNLAYGLNQGRSAVLKFQADGINDVIARFWTGGNQFGVTGQTGNGVNINRIFTMNGFVLTRVPEPSLSILGTVLVLGFLPILKKKFPSNDKH